MWVCFGFPAVRVGFCGTKRAHSPGLPRDQCSETAAWNRNESMLSSKAAMPSVSSTNINTVGTSRFALENQKDAECNQRSNRQSLMAGRQWGVARPGTSFCGGSRSKNWGANRLKHLESGRQDMRGPSGSAQQHLLGLAQISVDSVQFSY